MTSDVEEVNRNHAKAAIRPYTPVVRRFAGAGLLADLVWLALIVSARPIPIRLLPVCYVIAVACLMVVGIAMAIDVIRAVAEREERRGTDELAGRRSERKRR